MPLGGQHGAQNPPKTRPKSMKNRWKMDIKNDENFECILNGFLVALGANMAPKPSQNPSPRRCPLGVPLGSWRALGGLLGPLGAQEPILSIFDRFLIDFYWFFERFLDDFWLIFSIVFHINSNKSNNNNNNNKNSIYSENCLYEHHAFQRTAELIGPLIQVQQLQQQKIHYI